MNGYLLTYLGILHGSFSDYYDIHFDMLDGLYLYIHVDEKLESSYIQKQKLGVYPKLFISVPQDTSVLFVFISIGFCNVAISDILLKHRHRHLSASFESISSVIYSASAFTINLYL